MISNRQRQLSHFSRHAPRTQLLHLLFALLFLLQLLPNRIVVGIGIVIRGRSAFRQGRKCWMLGRFTPARIKSTTFPTVRSQGDCSLWVASFCW